MSTKNEKSQKEKTLLQEERVTLRKTGESATQNTENGGRGGKDIDLRRRIRVLGMEKNFR